MLFLQRARKGVPPAGLTAVLVIVMVAGAFAQGPATNATPTGGGTSPRGPGVPRGPKLDARLDYAPGQAPKFWSVATAETIMARYPDYRAAYYNAWTYVHGYTLYAFEIISKATGDKKYMDYMKRYLDNFVDQDGRFSGATLGNLDNMMTGNSIIALYELTGDERYKTAAGQFRHALDKYPQSSDGQFYHNDRAANMWIDGIFMGQMMLTRYGKSIGDSQFCWDTATRQFTVFAKHCLKGDSGLYFHAWTEVEPLPNWADPKTHTSPEVWSEGLGWYALVLVETLPLLPKDHPKYAETLDIVKRLAAGLKRNQDASTGGWWMIVDKGGQSGNWIDPSGTGMFTYFIQKGVEVGVLDKAEYESVARRGWEALKPFAKINNNGLVDISGGGDGIGIKGDFNSYVSVRRQVNAKETVGAFLWASAIMEKGELEKAKAASSGEVVPTEPLPLVFSEATTNLARFTPPRNQSDSFAVEFDASPDQEPDVTFPLVGAPRNLLDWPAIAVDVTNPGIEEVMVMGIAGKSRKSNSAVYVKPGATETLWVFLRTPGGGDPAYEARYTGMYGRPGDRMFAWYPSDPRSISTFSLRSPEPRRPVRVIISRVRLSFFHPRPKPDPLSDDIFPIVDAFGQYNHRDWPGKTHSTNDLAVALAAEERDLAAHPGPADWDQYGGWTAGPQLRGTGHFHTEKVGGRWWLVDPDGHLFWSVGCNEVSTENSTRVIGRENLFSWVPAQNDPQFAPMFRNGSLNFYTVNLARKFGPDWDAKALGRVDQRLRSWGINSIGSWSDERVARQHRTPYTYTVSYRFPTQTTNSRLPDAANPAFRTNLRAALERAAQTTANDPWCIGYWIDNELHWPATNGGPNAEAYFRICREEVKRAAPNTLYLGSRFALQNWPEFDRSCEDVIAAAARWCDVVSFNHYRFNPGRLNLPAGFDKPIIIGEFHFGALDRGLLHIGVRGVGTVEQRAQAYIHYLHECLENPAIVGAHWFRYADQPVSGRSDGENYLIGFVDVCDNPYPELTAALREIGYNAYRYRSTAIPQ